MTSLDIDSLTEQLAGTQVEHTGVTFLSRGLKLDTAYDAAEVVEAINNCASLNFLCLEGNTLGVEAAIAIAAALEKHGELQRALWKDLFTGRLKTEIPDALRYLGEGLQRGNVHLVELDLSDNALGPVGLTGLQVLLASPTCYSLQELRLVNNGLGIYGGKMLADALLECHKKSSEAGKPLALRILVCGRNRLENEGAKFLAEVFKTLGTLEEVAMPQNGIYHVGISALADAFTHNPNLQRLNMNDNIFSTKGAAAMANALPSLTHLISLNLGDCLLKTKGAMMIANALEGHEDLEELNVGFNEIRINSGIVLSETVLKKSKIKEVVLNGNQFGEDGCSQIQILFVNAGKGDALGVLSEDEEDSGEEEDSDDEDDAKETVKVIIKEEKNDNSVLRNLLQTPQNYLNASVVESSPTKKKELKKVKATVSEFLLNPTAERLLGIGKDPSAVLLNHVTSQDHTVYINTCMEVVMKVSSLTVSRYEHVKDLSLHCVDELLGHLFKWSIQEDKEAIVCNAILVYIGVIKCEDRTFKVDWNLEGSLIALDFVAQKTYFPTAVKSTLQIFLARPNKNIDVFTKAKHRLMQTLFQY